MPGRVLVLSFALVAFSPALSAAANPECPDGWFCESNAVTAPPASPPPSAAAAPQPAPPVALPPPPPGMVAVPVYGPAGYPPGYYLVPIQPPPLPKKKKPKKKHGFHEWGFNLHVDGALLGNQPEHDRAMGGLGFGFRYRPVPHLAFNLGFEVMRGAEYDQHFHREAALLFDTQLFFNPRDVVQFYGLVGMGFSNSAWVRVQHSHDDVTYADDTLKRDYFGGQAGLGLEVRVSHRIALGGDVIGFIRGRIDEHDGNAPDAVPRDPNTGEHATGGGLLRLGMTIYW